MTVSLLYKDARVLPRCTGATPETSCTCAGSFLAFVAGGWVHVAVCESCLPGGVCPTPNRHFGCDSPEPVKCLHGTCRRDVELEVPCAYGIGPCCGCCWVQVPR